LLVLPKQVDGQFTPAPVEISKVKEVRDGKTFYLHTVKENQTLFSIARAYRVSTLIIAEANPNHPGLLRAISVGQEILIPILDSTPPPTPPISRDALLPIGLLVDQHDGLIEKDCLNPELKSSYDVALLIPLFLDRFSEPGAEMPNNQTSFAFLPYYQGVLLALDSVRRNGTNINLHTFDVGREASAALEIIKRPELAKMDLIIGPFYQEALNIVVPFARQNGISVVSPLLESNDQLINNPNLFQAVPSTQNQLINLASFLRNKPPGQNIILVHNNVAEALPLIDAFKNAMQTRAPKAPTQNGFNRNGGDFMHGYFINGSFVGASRRDLPPVAIDLPRQQPTDLEFKEIILGQAGATVSRIVSSLDRNRNNVIVSLLGNEVIVSNMMRELNLLSSMNPVSAGAFNITLIGPARWEEFLSIDLKLFESLNVHIMSTDFVDYTHSHIRSFVRRYREVFNDEPNTYAFWGAQTAFMFFNSLARFGRDFANCIERANLEGSQPTIPFKRLDGKNNGWINSNFIIYRITDFRRQCVLTTQ